MEQTSSINGMGDVVDKLSVDLDPIKGNLFQIRDRCITRPKIVESEANTCDPFSGVIYVFRAKRADRIKLVWWDGTGLCLMAKKLEQGGFKWPGIQDGVMRLTAAQLGALLEGLDGAGCMADASPSPRKLPVDGAFSC
ncbi:IS66 family insertion sequence element accessory protein TnpB [Novosphingobium sp.]|uniref:IS66 family insertion sequence element accessory protein TnpB n=1 Tax=Novosphingobium sp. TaxID=1874826 RepID=UPI003B51AC65